MRRGIRVAGIEFREQFIGRNCRSTIHTFLYRRTQISVQSFEHGPIDLG